MVIMGSNMNNCYKYIIRNLRSWVIVDLWFYCEDLLKDIHIYFEQGYLFTIIILPDFKRLYTK